MGSLIISRALVLALVCSHVASLTPLSAAGDDNDCALYLSGPGRTSAYDYTLNLLKGNFGYEGQHTCITYDAVNQAYREARNRIVVAHPKGDWKAEDFASVGELILDISVNLARRYGLTYEEIEKGLPLIDTSRTLIRDVCPPVFSHVECRAGKYRRFDGLCNNLHHPTWGSTMSPFQRLLGPLFSDGINAPRIAHTGRDLPLSRVVSRTMHPDEGYHDHAGTVMVIAWGQFMDHDYTLTGTPLDPRNRNDPEECCTRPPHLKHPYCNEIRIPDDDYFYRLWNVKCIDFVRAFPSPRPGCRLGSRVPFNTLTGVIDGNTVYGVTEKFSRKLRTGFGGLLRMNPVFQEYGLKDLLPLKLDIPDEGCTRPNSQMYCFEAGEIRVNEQLVLTVMHTLMAREHNRVAKALAHVNPHWDDETLFQEARRINIAEIQHITYNEFLPILLGKDVMEKFGLVLEKEGHWDGYDPTVNPDVIDAFASAAFRFGHSLLPTAVERWSKAHKFIASKRLSDLIRRPFDLYRAGVLDEYVMGLMNQVAQAMDDSITQEVTNHLFKKVGARFGMDLVSFNMQRGREFGIPGYMEFRKFCGLNGANTFQDLFGSMPNETVRKYESIFEHPIDVDLWSGGVSERPLPGSMLGPTFACVIATQFSYSRRGDRFWFELPNQPSSFTPEQLHEIRKARLARVICDNTDIIDTVQLYPMVLPDHELNPRVPCRSGIIPSMDFSKWAEPAPFHGPKPFITEANATKIEHKDEENSNNTKIGKISTNETLIRDNLNVIDNRSKSNETAKDTINCHKDNTTSQNCILNDNDKQKVKATHGIDTILKYVYKKEDKAVEQKSGGPLANSVEKKKRSTNEGLRYAASAPLIVSYETSHGSRAEPLLRQTGNIIKSEDLADFNIETLHDNQPNPFKNHEEVNKRKHNNEKDNQSKSQEDEKSNESEEKTSASRKGNDNSSENNSDDESNQSDEDSYEHSHGNERYQNNNENSSKEKDGRDDERNRDQEDSREQREYKNKESSNDSSDENQDNDHNNASYRRPEHTLEHNNDFRVRESDDSGENNENNRRNQYPENSENNGYRSNDYKQDTLSPYKESEEKHYKIIEPSDSREINENSNNSQNSKENSDSVEKSHQRIKSEYTVPSKDSNEGGESSEEAKTYRHDSREKLNNKENNKLSYPKYRDDSSESNGRESSKENEPHQNINSSELAVKNNYSTQPESEEEEAIIAIMTKKKKPDTPKYYNNRADKKEINSPIKIKDIDLGDFNNYERIHVNSKGIVVPVTDTHEDYDTLSVPLIPPLNDLEPVTVQNDGKQFARSTYEADKSQSSESNEDDKKLVHIDADEVKPVVEINSDKDKFLEDNSKEAIKANPDQDTSLETLLGVKLDSEEKDKVVEQPEEQNKEDAKQQFERIPLNYNHAKKEQEQNNDQSDKSSDANNSEKLNEHGNTNTDNEDESTPKEPVQYDEHLNFKFDDISIKLPEIKLPDDILAIPDEEPFYPRKEEKRHKKPKKKKFFHYDEQEYNPETHGLDHEAIYNHEDHGEHEPSFYGNYHKGNKNENYRQKKNHNEEDDEDEEEDLYEKFVRERFGRSGNFKERSEKLTEPTIPLQENQKLFKALNLVLEKASNIEKEAQKSGDPNAGYMWTVEYKKPL